VSPPGPPGLASGPPPATPLGQPAGQAASAPPQPRRLSWRTRIVLAQLLALAGGIHLLLTPQHFAERPAYGVFFFAAATWQLWLAGILALRADPPAWLYRLGIWGSLAVAALWVTTRTLAPPLPGGQVEPVTLAGVAATALELAALLALVALFPAAPRHPAPGRPRFAAGWAVLAGAGFAVLFALASGTLVYTPTPLPGGDRVPSITVADEPLPLGSPLVTVFLTRHLSLLGPLAVFVFLPVAAALLAASTGLGIGLARAAPHCPPGRGGLAAVAPSLLAVPVCCGAPLAGILGTGVLLPLLRVTPWLLAATTVLLAVHVAALWRRWRRWAAAGHDPPPRGAALRHPSDGSMPHRVEAPVTSNRATGKGAR
jgi:hypothetical protein